MLRLFIQGQLVFHIFVDSEFETIHEQFWRYYFQQIGKLPTCNIPVTLEDSSLLKLKEATNSFIETILEKYYWSVNLNKNISIPHEHNGIIYKIHPRLHHEDFMIERYFTLWDCVNQSIISKASVNIYDISPIGHREFDLLKEIFNANSKFSIKSKNGQFPSNEITESLNKLKDSGLVLVNNNFIECTPFGRLILLR